MAQNHELEVTAGAKLNVDLNMFGRGTAQPAAALSESSRSVILLQQRHRDDGAGDGPRTWLLHLSNLEYSCPRKHAHHDQKGHISSIAQRHHIRREVGRIAVMLADGMGLPSQQFRRQSHYNW